MTFPNSSDTLLVFGGGYTGMAIARAAVAAGMAVMVTQRAAPAEALPRTSTGPSIIPFAEAGAMLARVTHVVSTIPPRPDGVDPVLSTYGEALRDAGLLLRWVGYLSTTGVYGDRQGGWVDETTPPAPGQERSKRRLMVEEAWRDVVMPHGVSAQGGLEQGGLEQRASEQGALEQEGGPRGLALFRVAGIYGPGRSALDEIRAGRGRRVIAPGHCFGRIHRDDIARAVLAAMSLPAAAGQPYILHLADDLPAPSSVVMEEAARLLGQEPPPAVALQDAWDAMSPMARSFWAERRLISNQRTKQLLGLQWRYPTYREGLRAILAEATAVSPTQQA